MTEGPQDNGNLSIDELIKRLSAVGTASTATSLTEKAETKGVSYTIIVYNIINNSIVGDGSQNMSQSVGKQEKNGGSK